MLNIRHQISLTFAALMLIAAPLPAVASGKKAAGELTEVIASAKKKNALNEGQKVVADALERFAKSYVTCEEALGGNSRLVILTSDAVIDTAPSWLVEAAQKTFVDKEDLNSEVLALIANHRFLSDVTVTGDVDSDIRSDIHKALLEASPMSGKDLGGKIRVDIRSISASLHTIGFKLNLTFDNGQNVQLQFRNVDIGVKTKSQTIAQLTIAAIFSRVIVTSDAKLRQEMNALRYDLMRAMRISAPGMQQKIAGLVSSLEEAQPKKGLFSGFLSGSTMFTGLDAILGRSFLAYLQAKEELISIAQQMQSKAAQTTGAKKASRQQTVQFVQRSSRTVTTGKNSPGFYAPRSQAVSRRERDETSGLETFLWLYDPFYMLSHPWYWGSRNGSFMNYWMMYDWITENNHRHDQETRSHFQPTTPYDMNRFDQPVDPVFTNRDDHPFVNPWDRNQIKPEEQIAPTVDRHGGVSWADTRGTETPIREASVEEVAHRWNQTTGQSDSRAVEIALSEKESAAFTLGSDGGGWNKSERDSSIRGY